MQIKVTTTVNGGDSLSSEGSGMPLLYAGKFDSGWRSIEVPEMF